MIVSPLHIINKESKIKLVTRRPEHEPSKPFYVKLEMNFKMVFKDQFPKNDKLLEVNKGPENKFTSPSSQ